MQDQKIIKQKSLSKPLIPKKALPKEFFDIVPDRPDTKSPKRNSSKETQKLNKVLKHLDKMPDQSTERLFAPYPKSPNALPYFPIHLEEMITLSQISSTGLTSSVRKAIHCKSLTLFSIKQIPISTRQERKFLKDWIEHWQGLKNPNFVKIVEVFWNVPEGCVSIVSEYQNAGSLIDLTRTIGTVPELPLSQIVKFLLDCAKWMEDSGETFMTINPTQVLFDRKGKIKLSAGISKRIAKKDSEGVLMQIGMLVIRAIYDEQFEVRQRRCCFFHSIDENPIFQKLSTGLKDFLCGISKFEGGFTVEQALQHYWLAQEEYLGAGVDLKEIIGIEFKGEEYWEAADLQVNRICEALKVVLMGRKFSRPSTTAVGILANELGVPDAVLGEKLNAVYMELKN